jgi:hypothetical protein
MVQDPLSEIFTYTADKETTEIIYIVTVNTTRLMYNLFIFYIIWLYYMFGP